MWLVGVWVGLGLIVAVVVVGTVVSVTRGLRAWRDVKTLKAGLAESLARLGRASEELDRKTAALPNRTDELTRALARLAESRRRLAVLQGATQEANDALSRFTAFLPRK
jgi:hypothetical protein